MYIYTYIHIHMHILAIYGKRTYIKMSEVGEEWDLRRRRRAYDFRFEVSFIRWKSRDVSRNITQNGVLPSLVSMVSSVTNSHTGTVSSLCSKIQYCQHKRARLQPYKSNPHHRGLLLWDSAALSFEMRLDLHPKAHVSPIRNALQAARYYHTR